MFYSRSNKNFAWLVNPPEAHWDQILADFDGHPLQSAMWGNAKSRSGGPDDIRLMYLENETPLCIARVENKVLPGIGRVAWVPKGPVYAAGSDVQSIHSELEFELRRRGYIATLMTPYQAAHIGKGCNYRGAAYRTLVLDLVKGADEIWQNFPAKLRSHIRSALRKGVVVTAEREKNVIDEFYNICNRVSDLKKFKLPGSKELMSELVLSSLNNRSGPIHTELLVAKHQDFIIGGYLNIRVGKSSHNVWSGYDREFGISGVQDLLMWEIIKRSIEQGVVRYDQEGIDLDKNPTTYRFKKKFGGDELELPALHAYSLGLRGAVAIALGRILGMLE